MPRIKRIITLAAISAATFAPGIAGAAPIDAGPNPDTRAAQHAATSMSTPLDGFGLGHVHPMPTATTPVATGDSDHGGFHLDDAAIGAGAIAGFVLLGTAGALTLRRRAHPRHS